MSKFLIAMGSIYFVFNGIRAWCAVYQNDFASVSGYTNTALVGVFVVFVGCLLDLRSN
jgi:hypothetical protein